jgi:hypothetical protein
LINCTDKQSIVRIAGAVTTFLIDIPPAITASNPFAHLPSYPPHRPAHGDGKLYKAFGGDLGGINDVIRPKTRVTVGGPCDFADGNRDCITTTLKHSLCTKADIESDTEHVMEKEISDLVACFSDGICRVDR